MRTDQSTLAVGVVVGVLAGASSFLFAELAGVAVATGVAVAVVAVLTVRHPDTLVASDVPLLAVGRWSGLAAAFVTIAVGLTTVSLPLDLQRRLAVGGLLAAVGYAAWLFGVAYARGKSQ